jgi:hypothetical protein
MCDALRRPSHLLQAAGICVVLGKVCYQLADEFERGLQLHPDTLSGGSSLTRCRSSCGFSNTKASTTAATARQISVTALLRMEDRDVALEEVRPVRMLILASDELDDPYVVSQEVGFGGPR